MSELPLRRPALPGCVWIAERAGAHPAQVAERLLRLGHDGDLDDASRLEIAFLLAGRAVRTDVPGDRAPLVDRARVHVEVLCRTELARLDPWRLLGAMALVAGDVEAGLGALGRCETLAPSAARSLRLDAIRLLLELERPGPARALLASLPSGERADAAFRVAVAVELRSRGSLGEARRQLEAALDGEPSSLDVAIELARTQWAEGARLAAARTLAALKEVRPSCPFAEWNHILVLGALGREREAAQALATAQPAVRANPELRARLERNSPEAPVASVHGDLAAIALTDLLNLLGHGRSTGTLRLASKAGAGEVVLRDGKIVGATSPSHPGGRSPTDAEAELRILEALEDLITWSEGSFAFERAAATAAVASDVALETPVALLHACAGLDERRRALGR